MAGFDDPLFLIALIIIPILYVIYKNIMAKRKKAAMKFSHLAFIKTAMGDKKKIKRGELLFTFTILAIAFMIIGFANPHIPLEQTKQRKESM